MIDPQPTKIVYCFNDYQAIFEKYPDVVFQQGLPKMEDFDNCKEPSLVILDDLMFEADDRVV